MSEPRIVIQIGLPASGKSTDRPNVIEHYLSDNCVVVSSDDLIEKYAARIGKTYDDVFVKQYNTAQRQFFQDLEHALIQRKDIIVDRTNTSKISRKKILDMISRHGGGDYSVYALVYGRQLRVHEWIERLNNRPGKTIPYNVLFNMRKGYEHPEFAEGFTHIVYRS